MADNIVNGNFLVASDDVSGGVGSPLQIQRVKLDQGVEGFSSPVNTASPLITDIFSDSGLTLLRRLVKAVEALMVVDSAQRQRVTVDAISAALTLATVTTVGTVSVVSSVSAVTTVTTVSTVTNVSQFGGVDPRYLFIDTARNASATGVRANLWFS
jgi:hypothetical protein